ncbi:MAG: SRPBCC domain-containing protein [Bryobacteraceae bacterium]|nr:SRPBCC domain-containing protein [Bryobacteraceae bacterium]
MKLHEEIRGALQSARSHETVIEIDATPEEVWEALTNPGVIPRWFAPQAEVSPGPGGSITWNWGDGIVWRSGIETWEPPSRLRLTEVREKTLTVDGHTEPLEPRRLVQDYILETSKGKTLLRLVHSGFGSSADWDGEFEGTLGGWACCFTSLKIMLEKHRQHQATNRFFAQPIAGLAPIEALRRFRSRLPADFRPYLDATYETLGTLKCGAVTLSISAAPSPAGCVLYCGVIAYSVSSQEAGALSAKLRSEAAALQEC